MHVILFFQSLQCQNCIFKRRIQRSERSQYIPYTCNTNFGALLDTPQVNLTNTPLFCVNVKYDRVKVTRIRNSLMDEEL